MTAQLHSQMDHQLLPRSQSAFTCSKLTMETPEQRVKSVQTRTSSLAFRLNSEIYKVNPCIQSKWEISFVKFEQVNDGWYQTNKNPKSLKRKKMKTRKLTVKC